MDNSSSNQGSGEGEGEGRGSTPYSEEISIRINEILNGWSDSIEEQRSNLPRIPFPDMLNEDKNCLLEPQFIRIGPYHSPVSYSDTHQFNLRFLYSLRSRTRNNRFVNVCAEEICNIEGSMMNFYDQAHVKVFGKVFVERLLIDGCFIVEYLHLRKVFSKRTVRSENDDHRLLRFDKHLIPLIDEDLLLLINQLPFSLLDKIYQIAFPIDARHQFFESIASYFSSCALQSHTNVRDFLANHNNTSEVRNFLDMYYKISKEHLVYDQKRSLESIKSDMLRMKFWLYLFQDELKVRHSIGNIPRATFLHESGIELKNQSSTSILSVNFRFAALEIPFFVINSTMLKLLQNLCEMEEICFSSQPYFATYVKFMNHIIKAEDDIALLRRKCIIQHTYNSDKDAMDAFKKLMCTESSIQQDCYLNDTIELINRHLTSTSLIEQGRLYQKYFGNVWSTLGPLSAAALLVLTFLQTFYTLQGYYYLQHA